MPNNFLTFIQPNKQISLGLHMASAKIAYAILACKPKLN